MRLLFQIELSNSEHVAKGVAIERLARPKPRFNPDRPFLSTIELNASKNKSGVWSHHNIVQAVARESVRDLNRPLSRMDVFYTGSTTNLRKRSSPSIVVTDSKSLLITVRKATEDTERDGGHRSTIESTIYLSTIGLHGAGESESESAGWRRNLKLTLNTLLDTSLLSSPSFIILAVSGFLTLSCFYVPYNYLGQHLSKVSLTPLAFCVLVKFWLRAETFRSEISLKRRTCFAALRSVICVDLFGLAKLSNAFGILLTFMGFGAIVGSPLAAFMKDITGNFDVSFYIMGCLMTTSGAMCMPLRKIRMREEKR
uniref:MFS domain-containing protein n=1 Tax=Angiostrongylus cantonensis TaxID=6313 RepID=A0A0K0D526_ANGCA